MADDVVSVVMGDHRAIEQLFSRLEKELTNRRVLAAALAGLLQAHATAEEEQLYPAVNECTGLESQVKHSEHEHAQAEELARGLRAAEPVSSEFEETLAALRHAVHHHVGTEEQDVLPALKEAADRETLERLGEQFRESRERALEMFRQTLS